MEGRDEEVDRTSREMAGVAGKLGKSHSKCTPRIVDLGLHSTSDTSVSSDYEGSKTLSATTPKQLTAN